MHSPVVSFDSDELILVDRDDNVVGYRSKKHCHDGEGLLHYPVEVTEEGQLIIDVRSASA